MRDVDHFYGNWIESESVYLDHNILTCLLIIMAKAPLCDRGRGRRRGEEEEKPPTNETPLRFYNSFCEIYQFKYNAIFPCLCCLAPKYHQGLCLTVFWRSMFCIKILPGVPACLFSPFSERWGCGGHLSLLSARNWSFPNGVASCQNTSTQSLNGHNPFCNCAFK